MNTYYVKLQTILFIFIYLLPIIDHLFTVKNIAETPEIYLFFIK